MSPPGPGEPLDRVLAYEPPDAVVVGESPIVIA